MNDKERVLYGDNQAPPTYAQQYYEQQGEQLPNADYFVNYSNDGSIPQAMSYPIPPDMAYQQPLSQTANDSYYYQNSDAPYSGSLQASHQQNDNSYYAYPPQQQGAPSYAQPTAVLPAAYHVKPNNSSSQRWRYAIVAVFLLVFISIGIVVPIILTSRFRRN